MSDLQKNKDIIAEDIKKLSRGIVEAGNRYKAAQAAGKLDEAQSYVDMIRKLNDQENLLQGQYVQLVEKEKQPELERISALRQELEKPMAAPSPNYLGMYGSMGNMRGTPVYDTSQPSVEEQQARKREIIGELYKAPLGAGGMEAEQLPAGVSYHARYGFCWFGWSSCCKGTHFCLIYRSRDRCCACSKKPCSWHCCCSWNRSCSWNCC